MTSLLQVAGVWKSYRDGDSRTEVLRGVDLTLAAGEAVAVVGPSGAGKSTLLHLIGALDDFDAGRITVGDRDLSTLSRTELARLRNREIGFVFQFQELLPDFTAIENVMVPARIAGRSQDDARTLAASGLWEVGLRGLEDRFPAQLSGGERQRVALCRALINAPRLILADEPTGSLDHGHGEQVMELLLRLQREHATGLILVTHDREIARRCGRVLTLREGRLVNS